MAACENCQFGTLRDGPIVLCRRFPALAKVAPSHWCGEHQPLPVAAPEPEADAKAQLAKSVRRRAADH